MANDLNLPSIATAQSAGQHQTSNDADAAIANALSDIYTVDFTAGNVTLTAAQFRSAAVFVSSNLSATRVLTLPAVKRPFMVYNPDAADSITLTKGSTTLSIGPTKLATCYTDGTANGLIGTVLDAGTVGVTDIAANIAFSGDISPSQITANQNDYNPAGLSTASTLRLSTDASRNITGIQGGSDGRLLLISNVGSFDLVLKNQDAGSTAAYRMKLGSDRTLNAGAGVILRYDATDSRWYQLTPIISTGAGTESIIVAVGDETTAITTGTAKVTFRMPYAFTLSAVRASLTTASSSGLPTVDINESGVTILSTKITIDASEKTSTTALTAPVISDTALADDAEITIDIDVAGTGNNNFIV